jgi:hypothetical protein
METNTLGNCYYNNKPITISYLEENGEYVEFHCNDLRVIIDGVWIGDWIY